MPWGARVRRARVEGRKVYVVVVRVRFFFFNDTATTEIYTLSLHDALPINRQIPSWLGKLNSRHATPQVAIDRKSTRLNSSHQIISYAVFCLKKKNKTD